MRMKTKTIRHAIEVGLFAVAILATCAAAASAHSLAVVAKFTLPFEVHWGKNVLPPGDYTISMDSIDKFALLRSASGKAVGFTPIPILASSDKGDTALFVMVRGNERVVRSLNLPAHGVSLIYRPSTNAEREMFAKADQVQAVPVVTARK
jgi:hypothetical protein